MTGVSITPEVEQKKGTQGSNRVFGQSGRSARAVTESWRTGAPQYVPFDGHRGLDLVFDEGWFPRTPCPGSQEHGVVARQAYHFPSLAVRTLHTSDEAASASSNASCRLYGVSYILAVVEASLPMPAASRAPVPLDLHLH